MSLCKTDEVLNMKEALALELLKVADVIAPGMSCCQTFLLIIKFFFYWMN